MRRIASGWGPYSSQGLARYKNLGFLYRAANEPCVCQSARCACVFILHLLTGFLLLICPGLYVFWCRDPYSFFGEVVFHLGLLLEIRDFQKVVPGGPRCGQHRAGTVAEGSWGRFSPTNAMLFIGCMKRLLRLILGSPHLQYPPGELVCTVFACLVWGDFVCLCLDFFSFLFFFFLPNSSPGQHQVIFASKYLKKSNPDCNLPHQEQHRLFPGLSRGARGRSWLYRGWCCRA